MTDRRHAMAALVVVSAVALTACGAGASVAGPGPAPIVSSSGTSGQSGRLDPVGLVGSWRLAGTSEPAATVLRLAHRELALWSRCGSRTGGWAADAEGLLVADTSTGATGTCQPDRDPAVRTPGWLASAARFERDGEGWRLLDRSGAVVARLLPGGRVAPRPDGATELTEPPVADTATRTWLAEPAALPDDLRPASWRELVGRWEPAQDPQGADRPKPPYLQLKADGSWSASDGCNGSAGRWAVGADGRVLATSGGSTLIGCQNVDLGGWWGTAARAGFDGPTLVLVDAAGRRLVPLARTPVPPTLTHGPVTR